LGQIEDEAKRRHPDLITEAIAAAEAAETALPSRKRTEVQLRRSFAPLAAHLPGEVWLNREESDASRKKVRNTFTSVAVLKALKTADERLGDIYSHLYDWIISYGAHPNERALTSSLHIVKDPRGDRTHMNVMLLPTGGLPMQVAMKTCAQIGIAALKISALIFPKRFDEARLNDAIRAASQGL
jgi:hypothetical protein